MKISKKMQDAINVQMKNEYDNAFLYLSIASWFEQKNLKGFANWNFVQYQEEQEHAREGRGQACRRRYGQGHCACRDRKDRYGGRHGLHD